MWKSNIEINFNHIAILNECLKSVCCSGRVTTCKVHPIINRHVSHMSIQGYSHIFKCDMSTYKYFLVPLFQVVVFTKSIFSQE